MSMNLALELMVQSGMSETGLSKSYAAFLLQGLCQRMCIQLVSCQCFMASVIMSPLRHFSLFLRDGL
jgi:hypothetical protein